MHERMHGWIDGGGVQALSNPTWVATGLFSKDQKMLKINIISPTWRALAKLKLTLFRKLWSGKVAFVWSDLFELPHFIWFL